MARLALIDKALGLIERKPASDRFILRMLFFAFLGSSIYFGLIVNNSFVDISPSYGGVLTEGIIGTPRFVNPVLATTRADLDMSALIYSGLLKIGVNGELVPNIAEAVTISEDGRTYNITLKKDVRFHDGTPLTARDVVYTITLIQNPDLKSPVRGNWNGVIVEELGEYEINLVLEEAYTPFIENLTIGILPRHTWDELPIEQIPFSQLNTEPIGSGPFEIESVSYGVSGLIEAYHLAPFDAVSGRPNIDKVTVKFYKNESDLVEGFNKGEFSSTAQLPSTELSKINLNKYQVINEPLPRIFGIFLNQNKSAALRDESVRKALSLALDRGQMIDEILYGGGLPTESPVPSGFLGLESINLSTTSSTSTPLKQAREELVAGGWKQDDLGFWTKTIAGESVTLGVTLRTANTDLFDSTATYVAVAWRELGVEVRIEQFEQTDLLQSVIRPRDFEAILFGIDMSRAIDLYPFWHSSQKDDPGLNISQYANIEVDSLLEDALTEQDVALRIESVNKVANIITEELPAIFLFTPTFSYILDKDITTASITRISRPYERFMNIESWYAHTERLWPLFREDK
ncbi:ABC transporter substrate-binding protein [Candidatus Kaiserbacteria bacterium]|nr:ABC transporter substrate-binding protein [Candidatus Kaiserbacteria bacterium]